MITQSLDLLQTQGSIYLQKPNVWKAVHDPRLVDKLDYAQPVACPRCGKQTLHLYLYDDWLHRTALQQRGRKMEISPATSKQYVCITLVL